MATPPQFVPINPQGDINTMVAYYESLTGQSLPTASVERLILNVGAYMYSLALSKIQDAATQNLVEFASAPALDALGIYVGVTRLAASPASTTIQFTLGTHTGVTIPAGTRIASQDGTAVFQTVEDTPVLSGVTTATSTAECQRLGTSGNNQIIGAVSVILDTQPYLVSATNTSITAGGLETESDDALRARILLAPASFSTAGSVEAYRYHALTASSSLCDAAVLGPLDGTAPGTVEVYPLMSDGTTTPTVILDAVEAATTGDTVRPTCDTVLVIAPTRTTFNLTIKLTVYTGANITTAIDDVRAAVIAFFDAKRQKLGQDIRDSQIMAVVINASTLVHDVELVGWTDIVIAPTEFGVLDVLTVTAPTSTDG